MKWFDVIQQASIIVGIFVAIYGINAWKREHVGKRKLELAEDTLALFYEAIDAIEHMRHPFSFPSETDSIARFESESDDEFTARRDAYVVFQRYQQYKELFSKLHASRYRFMSQIGKDQAEPFNQLRELVHEINISAVRLSKLWAKSPPHNTEQFEKHYEQVEKYEAIIWDGFEDDPIKPQLKKIIEDMENTCAAIVSRKINFNRLDDLLK